MEFKLNSERYFDVAEFFFDRVKHTLKYNENNGNWTFEGEPCDEAKIHVMMVRDLARELLDIARQFSNRASASVDQNDRERMISASTNLMLITNKLQDASYREKLIKELVIIYKVLEQ